MLRDVGKDLLIVGILTQESDDICIEKYLLYFGIG